MRAYLAALLFASVLLAGCTVPFDKETGFPDVPPLPAVPDVPAFPVSPGFEGVDCGTNVTCFVGALQTCSPAFLSLPIGWQQINGKMGEYCLIESRFTSGQLRGSYTCRVQQRHISETGWFIPACEIATYCSGELAETLSQSCDQRH
ncbi:hypothetical protein HY546_02300 [archaeon]|nr:hypothetical protein [archaeon]